jgi:rhodanese-related sulfurtransferase
MARISPQDAQALMVEGWVYVDVRTEQEYEGGHPPGSLNVPLMVQSGAGKGPNADFVPALEALFDKDSKLILGCAGGGRSGRALTMLTEAGFSSVRDAVSGMPGWTESRLPVENGQPEDRSWQALLKRLQG